MSERSDHAEQLADHTPTGGGCLEIAEATADLRAENPQYTRRSVLGAIAGLSATPLASDSSHDTDATPQAVDPDQVEIIATSGKLRTLWMNRAIEEETVQLVGQAISDDGYSFYRDDVEVLYIRGRGVDDPFYTVYFHGENDADPENTTGLVVWSQHEEIETEAIGVAHKDYSGDGHEDHYQISKYNLMGGTLVFRSRAIENFGGCDDVRWDCVSQIAGSYAAMYGSCAICASSLTPPTCAVCLGAVGFHLASQHCPWCND